MTMKTRFEAEDDISFLSRADIVLRQTELLNEHIRYSRENSAYYKKTLADLADEDITIEELAKLPTTSKQDLALYNVEFTAVSEHDIADICFTSGTTGKPCRIAYTKGDIDRLAYNDMLGFVAAGITPADKVLLTCTIDCCFVAGLAYYSGAVKLGAAAIRNGINTLESHAGIIRTERPGAIVGVPSFLAKLGKYLQDTGIDCSSIHTLVCIGEPVRNRQMGLTPLGQKLQEIWPNCFYSTYASSEIVTSFTECSARSGGHPPADLAIVEILDEYGVPLPAGEPGEVTVTPLQVTGMPLVRFRTGDISFLIDEPCSCGRKTSRIGPIIGRKSQMLKIKGTTLFPSAFFTTLDSIDGVSDYYMEVGGDALSDEVEMFVSFHHGDAKSLKVAELLYAKTRLHVPIHTISEERAKSRIYGKSRKPVRFFDLRKNNL